MRRRRLEASFASAVGSFAEAETARLRLVMVVDFATCASALGF